jgi:hypothetical protein
LGIEILPRPGLCEGRADQAHVLEPRRATVLWSSQQGFGPTPNGKDLRVTDMARITSSLHDLFVHGLTPAQTTAQSRRTCRVVPLLTALWALSLADLYFTLWAHHYTPFMELNPLARWMLLSGSIGLLVAYKVSLTGVAATVFWRLRRYARAELALWLIVVVYIMLALQWANYTIFVVSEMPSLG